MPTLYFSKGSSALAAHILLEETGARYVARKVPIGQGTHRAAEFLRVNPKGRLPALQTDEGIITENPAILEYIAASHPVVGLLPDGPFEQAQARSLCAYLCATVHVAYAHGKRAERWSDDAAAVQGMQAKVAMNLQDCALMLEDNLIVGPWALGPRYSFCDPYLFLLGKWMAAHELTLDGYPKLARHDAAMRIRPAVQRVLSVHGLA